MRDVIIDWSIRRPKAVFWLAAVAVLLALSLIPRIQIDTDPENMLPQDNPARVLHDQVKHSFGLSDMVVVGVVNTQHPDGVYNTETLNKLRQLTNAVLLLEGVVDEDLMSLAKADNILQGIDGSIAFEWMLNHSQVNEADLSLIRSSVERLAMLKNTLVSADGKALGLFVPIDSKDQSYRIAQQISELVDKLEMGSNEVYITGLPVAEDTFGVEMFKQMAISAPAAGALIFAIMLFFFRSVPLVIAPMLVAMATVILTMGTMVGLGFSIHIMSSMIPIFLMPIAVVDSVHILSEFNDHYRPGMNKHKVISQVVTDLFRPMLFTSVTSIVGFASLNTADIPPVRIFGSFVAIGIGVAFLLSITLVPAYISLLSNASLDKMANRVHSAETPNGLLARILRRTPSMIRRYGRSIMVLAMASLLLSAYGIGKIRINDNPMNWFKEDHPIRQSDRVLNHHFAGTYEAFLSFQAPSLKDDKQLIQRLKKMFTATEHSSLWQQLLQQYLQQDQQQKTIIDFTGLQKSVLEQSFEAEELDLDFWDDASKTLDRLSKNHRVFLKPEILGYLERVQTALDQSGLVGKSTAITDILKTINRELLGGGADGYRIPSSAEANAQAVLTFQGSHRPGDIWRMVTPDYRSAVIWLQLKSGDNQDMAKVLDFMQQWFERNPPPAQIKPQWSGLSYINVVWQDAMVNGILGSLLSSFLIVAVMMMLLFRSIAWGLIAMLPLTITIAFIYGLIGITGKNYDMPVAVLSALTLGMSIDFAIHFIERSRTLVIESGGWEEGLSKVFEEPARAISRNALVIALGFTPLLLAPLSPYQTVGIFLASIMLISCVSSLLLLPSIMEVFQRHLFQNNLPASKE